MVCALTLPAACSRSSFSPLASWARSLFYLFELNRRQTGMIPPEARPTKQGRSMLNAPLMLPLKRVIISVLPCELVGPSATMVTR
jgi:hypothetical protein